MTGLQGKSKEDNLVRVITCQQILGTFHAIIAITAVKLQMFGGETCRVHGKIDRAGQGNSR